MPLASGVFVWHARTMADDRDQWSMFHFSEAGRGDVPELLRRVADSIQELGDIQVEDITFSAQPTDGADEIAITVYYHRDVRR
jgi:hypothetical protein